MATYRQAEKNAVRERILPAAIRRLTTERKRSTVVRSEEVKATVQCFLGFVRDYSKSDRWDAPTQTEMEHWLEYHTRRVECKTPESLRVLYLCGPEPLNDLEVLTREGVDPHNVWALTADKKDHEQAVRSCADAGIPLKVHRGQLAEFFNVFNETFDIIYVDACGPFAGGKPNTINPIISVFERQRLNSPGVLITNFCEPPDDGEARERYVDMVTAFFTPRYRDLPRFAHQRGPDPAMDDFKAFRSFARDELEPLYSELITRLIVDISMKLLPNCRALSMTSLYRSYLSAEEGKTPQLGWNLNLTPSSYPLAAFVVAFGEYRKGDPLLKRLHESVNHQHRNLRDLAEAASMLDSVLQGHWETLSEPMRRAVDTPWFDSEARLTCDTPLPNLTINALLGIYGRPWFVNPRCSDRVTYRAQQKRMYCDMLVMDQCRPFFDWFPTVDALPTRFNSVPFQIVARCILDRIERHHFESECHPFRGAAVCGHGEHPLAEWYNFGERERLS